MFHFLISRSMVIPNPTLSIKKLKAVQEEPLFICKKEKYFTYIISYFILTRIPFIHSHRFNYETSITDTYSLSFA